VVFMRQGLALFPDDGALLWSFAQLAWKIGAKEEARKMLAHVLAHPGKMQAAELTNARDTETQWLFLETMENVKKLMDEKKAIEALRLVDMLLAKKLPVHVRGGLVVQQRIIAFYAKAEEAKVAAKEGRPADARRLCGEILNTPGSPSEARILAEQVLRRLDQPVDKTSSDQN